MKRKYIDDERERLINLLSSYKIEEAVSEDEYQQKLEVLKYGLQQDLIFPHIVYRKK